MEKALLVRALGAGREFVDDLAAASFLVFAALGKRSSQNSLDVPQFLHPGSDLGKPLLNEALHPPAGSGPKQRPDVIECEAGRLRCANEAEAFELALGIDPVVYVLGLPRLDRSVI